MTFPQDILPITADLKVGGVWTDISDYVYSRDSITVTPGRSSEGSALDTTRCTVTLNNRDGRFSPTNPLSPYYGRFGRNTPLRICVDAGAPFLALDGDPAGYVSTPDAAGLDITGDIDVRAEVAIDWRSDTPQTLIQKWDTVGNQRSWLLRAYQGNLKLLWSADGTIDHLFSASAFLPNQPGRSAVRVTVDTDNGHGGFTVALYQAPTLAGPWTLIISGSAAAATSIYASTASLRVGGYDTDSTPERVPYIGRGYRFEVRRGIDGPVVAAPDFTAQTPGTSAFADGVGLPWTVHGSAAITNRRVRFTGEASEWPSRWTTGGKDIWVPVQASGILRRLTQGASPLQSPVTREFTNPARESIIAYWPCEDGRNTSVISSPLPGVPPMLISTTGINPAADTTWPASGALPTMGTGTLSGTIPTYTPTGEAALRMGVILPADGLPATAELVTLYTDGGASGPWSPTGPRTRWTVTITTTRTMELRAYNAAGDTVLTRTGLAIPHGVVLSLGLELTQNGTGVDYKLVAFDLTGATLDFAAGQQYIGTVPSRIVGRAKSVIVGAGGKLGDTVIGHIAEADRIAAYAATLGALIGWDGEGARARAVRLCREENIPLVTYGTSEQLMGPQKADKLLTLLQSTADVGGTLYEQPDTIGLAWRARDRDYDQAPRLTLSYTADGEVVAPLDPVVDDSVLRNDVTVTRDGGASGRSVLESGPLSVLPPPEGVGLYTTSVTLPLHDDDQPEMHAAWMRHLGTWDAARYPQLTTDLAAAPHLIDQVVEVGIRDRITISDLPPWLPPDGIDLLVEGWAETIEQYAWTIRWVCSPGGPWVTAKADVAKAAPDGAQLAAAATATATTLTIRTTAGPLWSTNPADYPADVVISGERITVTAVSGAASPQSATVTRGANGIVKALPAGAAVTLAVRPIPSL